MAPGQLVVDPFVTPVAVPPAAILPFMSGISFSLYLIITRKLAAWAAGGLHAGSPDGPLLRPAALPYAVPELDDPAGAASSAQAAG